jgi:hypothetical protein
MDELRSFLSQMMKGASTGAESLVQDEGLCKPLAWELGWRSA